MLARRFRQRAQHFSHWRALIEEHRSFCCGICLSSRLQLLLFALTLTIQRKSYFQNGSFVPTISVLSLIEGRGASEASVAAVKDELKETVLQDLLYSRIHVSTRRQVEGFVDVTSIGFCQ